VRSGRGAQEIAIRAKPGEAVAETEEGCGLGSAEIEVVPAE